MDWILAGSRDITRSQFEDALVQSDFTITADAVICGEARGADTYGREMAELLGIPVRSFPVTAADWDMYGKSAGVLRNNLMAREAHACLVVWDGQSTGSLHMIRKSMDRGLHLEVYHVPTRTHLNTYASIRQLISGGCHDSVRDNN